MKTSIKAKNEYEFTVDVCIGYTGLGEIFLIDIEDFDIVKNIRWYMTKQGYVKGSYTVDGKQKKVYLHRLVMNCPNGMMVDHKHGNQSRFDNRKENLRICTSAENQRNKPVLRNNSIGVKGVNLIHLATKDIYRAQITINEKTKHLGCFDTLEEASKAYDMAAIYYFGEFAKLNNL